VDARTKAQIAQRNAAQAALQGYGTFNLAQWVQQQRARGNLGVINNLSQGSAALTGPLLANAQASGQDLAAVGSLLGTAGSLAGVYSQLYPYITQPQQPRT